MVRSRAELADRERLQRRTVRVLVAGQALGGAAIGVGGAVSRPCSPSRSFTATPPSPGLHLRRGHSALRSPRSQSRV
jgi:hypothetical protein